MTTILVLCPRCGVPRPLSENTVYKLAKPSARQPVCRACAAILLSERNRVDAVYQAGKEQRRDTSHLKYLDLRKRCRYLVNGRVCGVEFGPAEDMRPSSWKGISRCPEHRGMKNRTQPNRVLPRVKYRVPAPTEKPVCVSGKKDHHFMVDSHGKGECALCGATWQFVSLITEEVG